MPVLYLIRHGNAVGSFGEEENPGLDELGRVQASAVARTLAHLGPLDIISSPFFRAQQTSEPLAKMWDCTPRIEPGVGEIPFPTKNPIERIQWLKAVTGEKWSNLDRGLRAWQRGVLSALRSLEKDTVAFTHFIAINVMMGEVIGNDRVVCFRPDNVSVTIVNRNGAKFTLVERGAELNAGSIPELPELPP